MNIFASQILTNSGGTALLLLTCTWADSSKIWVTCWRCCTGFCSRVTFNQQSPSVHRGNKHQNSNLVWKPKQQYEVCWESGGWEGGHWCFLGIHWDRNPLEKLETAIGSVLWIWVYQLNHQILRFNWKWAIVMHHTFFLVCQSLKINSFSSPKTIHFTGFISNLKHQKCWMENPQRKHFSVEIPHSSKEVQTLKSQRLLFFRTKRQNCKFFFHYKLQSHYS